MADSLYRLNSARAFPSDIEDMVQHIAAVRRDFLSNNNQQTRSVRSTIRESWQRCTDLIEPGRDKVPIVISSDAELNDLYQANDLLLKAANGAVKRLTEFVAGSGYIIGLADSRGRLLQVSGDKNAIRWMERIGLAPGGDWSEANAGTNGIGTALATGRAVRVIGPEHFCDGWQDITCITVPIRSTQDGKIAGLLDISGNYHLVKPFFVGILTAAALEIRENLKNLSLIVTPEQPYRVLIPNKAINRSGYFPPGKDILKKDEKPENNLEERLNSQEQRTFAAERLAIAIGSVSASLDLEMTLAQVAEQAAHLLDVENAGVCLFDENRNISFFHTWSISPPVSPNIFNTIQVLMEEPEVINLLYESCEPVTIDDLQKASHLPVKLTDQTDIRALALLPLMGARNANGIIILSRNSAYHWQPNDLRLELTFALHATTAIENARLFQSLQRHYNRVEVLNTVNQLLHTLFDPAQQLNLIIKRIVEILDLDAGLILLDQHGSESFLSAHYGLKESALTRMFEMVAANHFNDKPMIICKFKPDDQAIYYELQKIGFCDMMVAPLVAGCDVLGFIFVGSIQHHELTREDLTLFTSIGQQLGLTLKNVQLLRAAGEAQALREADRIKSRFLMMISHDLRSPLTAIRTSVESLLDKSSEQPSNVQEHLLRNIAGQAKRLGGLVDQLLDLLRIEAGALSIDRDWTELVALISDTITKFERLNAPCKIRQHLDVNLPLVYIDPDRMIQVLWNLLENAYKYSPDTSEITIQVLYLGQEILIQVADRGPGIPVEEHEKIFQYFYRLDREQQMRTPGSGLGLAICRGIIEAHGGRIWVENRNGGGSIFSIVLPPSLIDSKNLINSEDNEFEHLPR